MDFVVVVRYAHHAWWYILSPSINSGCTCRRIRRTPVEGLRRELSQTTNLLVHVQCERPLYQQLMIYPCVFKFITLAGSGLQPEPYIWNSRNYDFTVFADSNTLSLVQTDAPQRVSTTYCLRTRLA